MKKGSFLLGALVLLMVVSLPAGVSYAHTGYHYAGVSMTADAAYYTTATMKFNSSPLLSECTFQCHVVGWTTLAEDANFNSYVEAGIGFIPIKHTVTEVALWWTNQKEQVAQIVGYVPLGTPVKVEIQKLETNPKDPGRALITWSWGANKKKTKKVNLGDWKTGPGIHPTKLEVAKFPNAIHPRVSFEVSDINILPEDLATAFLQQTDPYIPVGTLNAFSVTY